MEIIRNQLENVNTEIALERAQNEKVLKSFNYLKTAYSRLKGEAVHKKGRKLSKSRGQKSQLNTPQNGADLNKSALMNMSGLLDISGLSAFHVPDDMPNRLSIGAQSDLG